jgi:site-specific DNA recombinase
MNVLVYARVSHDSTGRGRSVTEQEAEAREWATREGWTVARVVTETGSASRYAHRQREGWVEVMKAIRTREVDAVLVWEASRATRDLGAYTELREACSKHGVKLGYDGTLYDLRKRDARLRTAQDAVMAEDEAARTSERVQRSVRANAEKGRPHGKQIYGYRRLYDEKTRALVRVEEDPDQAIIVREAADRVLKGETFYSIAQRFNRREVPPRRESYKAHRAQLGWTPVAIKQMLSMPAYAAKRQHQGAIIGNADWPALIDPDVWEKLQQIMNPPERRRTNDWPAKHLLAGIAVCGVCGAVCRVGKQNAGRQQFDPEGNALPRAHYNTYACTGTPGKTGFHVAMRESHLDMAVTEAVLARLERPDFLATLGQQDKGVDSQRQALLDEIAKDQAWLEQVRERAERERTLDLLFDQEARVKPKIRAAQRRLESLAETDPMVLNLARSDAVRETWDQLELADRRRVIRGLVAPRINRVTDEQRGRRGLNLKRLDMVWR